MLIPYKDKRRMSNGKIIVVSDVFRLGISISSNIKELSPHSPIYSFCGEMADQITNEIVSSQIDDLRKTIQLNNSGNLQAIDLGRPIEAIIGSALYRGSSTGKLNTQLSIMSAGLLREYMNGRFLREIPEIDKIILNKLNMDGNRNESHVEGRRLLNGIELSLEDLHKRSGCCICNPPATLGSKYACPSQR